MKKLTILIIAIIVLFYFNAYADTILNAPDGIRTGEELDAGVASLCIGLDDGTNDYYATFAGMIDWIELSDFTYTGTLDFTGATVSGLEAADTDIMKKNEDETITGWHEFKGRRDTLLTEEPTNIQLNDYVYCDISEWNPAGATGADNYMAQCVEIGDPNMYVAHVTDKGATFYNSIQRPTYGHDSGMYATYFDDEGPVHTLLAKETRGATLTNAEASGSKTYELTDIVYGMDFWLQAIETEQMDLKPPSGGNIWFKAPDVAWTQIGADYMLRNAGVKGETLYCWSTETDYTSPDHTMELFCKCDEVSGVADWAAVDGVTACDDDQAPIENGTASAGSLHTAAASTSRYRASQFVYTGTNGKQICQIDLSLSFNDDGSPNEHTYFCAIYTNSADDPDTIHGSASDEQNMSVIGTSETTVSFVFSTPTTALVNGTTYWVVLYSASHDSDDYVNWHWHQSGVTEHCVYSEDGSAWADSSTDKTFKFKLWSE